MTDQESAFGKSLADTEAVVDRAAEQMEKLRREALALPRGLLGFLNARLDEDEVRAKLVGWDSDHFLDAAPAEFYYDADGCAWLHLRVLAEVEAKRKIIELHTCHCINPACGDCDACSGAHHADPTNAPCDTIKALAKPYADHPDYLEEW